MKTYYLIIQFNELLVWYETGELRVSRERLELGAGSPSEELKMCLVEKMPHVDLEQEHGVLVAKIKYEEHPFLLAQPLAPTMCYLPFFNLLEISPLTERASNLLQGRLEGMEINLSPPFLENEVAHQWNDWLFRQALLGAQSLVDLVSVEEWQPNRETIETAKKALESLNQGARSPSTGEGILSNILCYDRHKPVPNVKHDGILDLGILLGELNQNEEAINRLRVFCKSDSLKLADIESIWCDKDLQNTLEYLSEKIPFDIDFASAALFLRWKYQYQKRNAFDLALLQNEISAHSKGFLNGSQVIEAIWLLGFYMRFPSLSTIYYSKMRKKIPVLASNLKGEDKESTSSLSVEEPRLKVKEFNEGKEDLQADSKNNGSSESQSRTSIVRQMIKELKMNSEDKPNVLLISDKQPDLKAWKGDLKDSGLRYGVLEKDAPSETVEKCFIESDIVLSTSRGLSQKIVEKIKERILVNLAIVSCPLKKASVLKKRLEEISSKTRSINEECEHIKPQQSPTIEGELPLDS